MSGTRTAPAALGLGGAPIGNLFGEVPAQAATATLQAAWDVGIRYFDTAPLYGLGLSERRVGDFLRSRQDQPWTVSTKVGRLLVAPGTAGTVPDEWPGGLDFESLYDYTYDGLWRSLEDSLQRLGVSSVDTVFLHDLDEWHHGAEAHVRHRHDFLLSGYRALEEMKAHGVVRSIGAGINQREYIPWLLDSCEFDVLLIAGEYTLLRHEIAEQEMILCEARGVRWVVGGIFNSGVLAAPDPEGAHYDYKPVPEEIAVRVHKLAATCATFGVPLPAAALQFAAANPLVDHAIPGMRNPEEVADASAWMGRTIPPELWHELSTQGLISERVADLTVRSYASA